VHPGSSTIRPGSKRGTDQSPLVRTNLAQMQVMEPWVSFPGHGYVQVRDGMMLQAAERVVQQGDDPQATLSEAAQQLAPLLPPES
jgi:sn-glycerol 3-phosphate transport system substrate-binding protein